MLHLVNRGLSILRDANDAVFFIDYYLEKAHNLKLLHYVF
jgi:hypothetical protein